MSDLLWGFRNWLYFRRLALYARTLRAWDAARFFLAAPTCALAGHDLCVADDYLLVWSCRCGRRSETAAQTLVRVSRS